MKTIGLIGGLSWHSSAIYYKHLNQITNNKLGELSSARLHMINLDFELISKLMLKNDWVKISEVILPAAIQLQGVGCSAIVIANNTLHQITPVLKQNLTVPVLHIADTLGETLVKKDIAKIGLLGTRSTMQSDFYKERLFHKYGVDTIIPFPEECEWINETIFNKLCRGEVNLSDRLQGLKLIDNLIANGAQAIALACTELPMLFTDNQYHDVQLLDTSLLHCEYAVQWSLGTKKRSLK